MKEYIYSINAGPLLLLNFFWTFDKKRTFWGELRQKKRTRVVLSQSHKEREREIARARVAHNGEVLLLLLVDDDDGC